MKAYLTAAALLVSTLGPGAVAAQATALPPCLSLDEQRSAPPPKPTGAPVLDAFARFDAAPSLRNREEVARALEQEYPPENRRAGIGGQTYIWVLVDVLGVARAGQVNVSSGCQELDEAALRAAEVMEFTPAIRDGQPVAVWIPIAIDFDPLPPGGAGTAQTDAPSGEPGETPSFTPFDVAPVMLNRSEVAAALRREYPRALREAVVSGRTIVWIRLDDRGMVQNVDINVSSGRTELDEAALRVARIIRFSPAMNRGEVVPVWVSIPISFQP